MHRIANIILALSAIFWANTLSGAEIRGQLELFSAGGGKRLGANELRNAVIYYIPDGGSSVSAPSKPLTMATRGKSFEPRVLPIVTGTQIRFPNDDPILHNVFSVSPGNLFDLGFYRKGDSKTWTFEKSGLVRVFCNVHYSMIGFILVLDTPFFTKPDSTGAFRLTGLPEGGGTLRIWQERGRRWSQRVSLPLKEQVKARLEQSRRRPTPHLNKFGKPYKKGRRDERYR
ncbi:MAG: hypothetical protein K0U98_19905 [Deltaproteobacteria bacterium]|nr:hypothetical protein [Deltaproteobacteria bacterium]